MTTRTTNVGRHQLPADGIEVAANAGKGLTRVHLDLAQDGISLATVGAASAALASGNRHIVRLTPSKDGITLALVGAASAATTEAGCNRSRLPSAAGITRLERRRCTPRQLLL